MIRKDMNCWHCNTKLIWGGDHDCEEDSEFTMETNLSCPECESFVLVYYKEPEHDSMDGDEHGY